MKKINFGSILNSLVLIACLLVSVDTVRNLINPAKKAKKSNASATTSVSSGPKLNTTFNLPGADLGKDATLILALSASCRFCQASVPFYQRLFAAAQAAAVPVAVVTQDEEPTKTVAFYGHLGLFISDIRKMSLGDNGIVGTPTLIALDRTGKITWARTGEVPEEQEPEVIAFVAHLSDEKTDLRRLKP